MGKCSYCNTQPRRGPYRKYCPARRRKYCDVAPPPAEITALYRAYDAAGQLLYVGISDDVFRRLREHDDASAWSAHAATITIERYPDRRAALAAELTAIHDERPLWNVVGVSSKLVAGSG